MPGEDEKVLRPLPWSECGERPEDRPAATTGRDIDADVGAHRPGPLARIAPRRNRAPQPSPPYPNEGRTYPIPYGRRSRDACQDGAQARRASQQAGDGQGSISTVTTAASRPAHGSESHVDGRRARRALSPDLAASARCEIDVFASTVRPFASEPQNWPRRDSVCAMTSSGGRRAPGREILGRVRIADERSRHSHGRGAARSRPAQLRDDLHCSLPCPGARATRRNRRAHSYRDGARPTEPGVSV